MNNRFLPNHKVRLSLVFVAVLSLVQIGMAGQAVAFNRQKPAGWLPNRLRPDSSLFLGKAEF